MLLDKINSDWPQELTGNSSSSPGRLKFRDPGSNSSASMHRQLKIRKKAKFKATNQGTQEFQPVDTERIIVYN